MQAGQNWWLSVWSEATAAAEADADPAGLHSRTYMLLYFGLGLSSLVFQASKGCKKGLQIAAFVAAGAQHCLFFPACRCCPRTCTPRPNPALPCSQIVKAVMLVFGSVNAARVLQASGQSGLCTGRGATGDATDSCHL